MSSPQEVTQLNSTINENYYITFQPQASGETGAHYINSQCRYNPSTGTLSINGLQFPGQPEFKNFLPAAAVGYLDSTLIQATAVGPTDIAGLAATITPRSVNSKIFISVRISGEWNNANSYDNLFGVKRNNSIIGMPTGGSSNSTFTVGTRPAGMAGSLQSYGTASDANSTMESVYFTYIDTPGTTASVTYQVWVRSGSSITLYVNRTVGDLTGGYERGTSAIILMEIL
jgi:hypothetical protein